MATSDSVRLSGIGCRQQLQRMWLVEGEQTNVGALVGTGVWVGHCRQETGMGANRGVEKGGARVDDLQNRSPGEKICIRNYWLTIKDQWKRKDHQKKAHQKTYYRLINQHERMNEGEWVVPVATRMTATTATFSTAVVFFFFFFVVIKAFESWFLWIQLKVNCWKVRESVCVSNCTLLHYTISLVILFFSSSSLISSSGLFFPISKRNIIAATHLYE